MKASKMDGLIDEVKAGLGQPIPPHQLKEKKVAKKVDKKKAKPEKESSKKSNGSDENSVTLAQLAKEAKISGAAARRKIRATEMERDGRWSWPKGSKQLATARKALGL